MFISTPEQARTVLCVSLNASILPKNWLPKWPIFGKFLLIVAINVIREIGWLLPQK